MTTDLLLLSTQVLWQFKKVSQHFPVFKPRVKHLQAYNMIIKKKFSTAKHMLDEAVIDTILMNNKCDSTWAEYNRMCQFSPDNQILKEIFCPRGDFYFLPIHTTSKP